MRSGFPFDPFRDACLCDLVFVALDWDRGLLAVPLNDAIPGALAAVLGRLWVISAISSW